MTEWKTTVGDETVIRGCAWSPPGCHPVGCGIKVHTKDGVVTKVEGDPEHPITRGSLCPRCLALKDYIYHPDRIIHPIKRAREDRGKDAWVETTWEDALDIIEREAKKVIEKYGPESIVVFGGTGREGNNYYNLIANCIFGTPNSCYAQAGWSCYGPRMSNTAFMIGGGYPEIDYAQKSYDRYDDPRYTAPECVLIWGKEPLKSNPDGLWGHAMLDLMRLGSKFIHVDPRMTWLGSRCDMVLRPRPGTDTALAMAFCNIIISEGLHDQDWCDKWTYGFDEFKERVQTMSPEQASEITGVPVDDIYAAARMFGNAKPSGVVWGLATDQNPNGAQLGQCLLALMAIQGFLDAPGGTLLGGVGATPSYQDDKTTAGIMRTDETEEDKKSQVQMNTGFDLALKHGFMTPETWYKRIGVDKYPAVGAVMWTVQPDEFLVAMETGDPYEIHMAMFQSSNPCGNAISAEPSRWRDALMKLDFNFATDLFHNASTMACADVVLPLASTIEHNAMVVTHYGMNVSFYGAQNKCVQVGECKSDVECMIELGKRFHPEFWGQFANEDEYNEFNGLNGILKWDELRDNVTLMTEENYRKYETGELRPDGQPGFPTSTGRVELWSYAYQMYGDDPLPYYKEPPFSPVSTPEKMDEYPFIVTSGARKYTSFHTEHRQIASLREIDPLPDTEINPEDARELGVSDGDWVKITTPFGSCKQVVKVTPTISRGVVHASHGWSFPEQSGEAPNYYGNYKVSINDCMPNGYCGVQGWGNTFKNMIGKVEKTENDVTDIASSADVVARAKADGVI